MDVAPTRAHVHVVASMWHLCAVPVYGRHEYIALDPRSTLDPPPHHFHHTSRPRRPRALSRPRARAPYTYTAHVARQVDAQLARDHLIALVITRASQGQLQHSTAAPCLASAVAVTLPCRRRAGPAAPNQRRSALSSPSSSSSSHPQPSRTVAWTPGKAVTVQAPPQWTVQGRAAVSPGEAAVGPAAALQPP
jgi:hypothetical protein